MPKLLRGLEVTRVDLVDIGANLDVQSGEGAHVVLYKAAATGGAKYAYIVKALAEIAKHPPAVVREFVRKATSFDEALVGADLGEWYERLCELRDAFWSALSSIVYDTTVTDKLAAAQESVQQFADALDSEVMSLLQASSVAKAGRKIAGARLTKLKDMKSLLDAVLSEIDDTLEDDAAPTLTEKRGGSPMFDVKKATPEEIAAHLASVEKRATDAEATLKAEQAKHAAEQTDEEILKSLPEPVRALVLKSQQAAADAQARATEAQEIAKRERDQRELSEFVAVVKGYTALPLNPDDDARLLQKISKAVTADEFKRVRAILDAADAVGKSGKLLNPRGSDGSPAGGDDGTALGRVQKAVRETIAKGLAKTDSEAQVVVFREHPDLYRDYRREVSIRSSSDPV